MNSSSELYEEIQEVVREYGVSIFRLAFAYLKNKASAEDIAQDVFVAYIQKAPKFSAEEKRRSWLLRVTGNKCKNLLRSASWARTTFLGEDLLPIPEESSQLLSYVFSLKEKYRIPIHLFYYEGYSLSEIARLLHSNPATVGTWLSRGRALLKTMIGDDFDA